MNYKKIEMGSYNLHVINTNKFKKIKVRVNLKHKIKKENITKRNLLSEILVQSNQNYKNQRELLIETENLYNMGISSKTSLVGNYATITFEGSFLNEKYTEKGYLEKSLKFFFDILFKPDIQNNKFNEESFNISYEKLKEDILSIKDSPKNYSLVKMFENMDKKAFYSYNPVGYLEDLENLTSSDLTDYYYEVIKSDIVDIFVIGEVDINEIKDKMTDLVKINTLKKPSETHFSKPSKFRKNPKTYKEKLDIHQSKLVLGCKIKELNDFEIKYVSLIYNSIFGSGVDSRLFKNIREKNSLCYYVYSQLKILSNIMYINLGIDKKDFKKAVKLIKSELIKMKNITAEELEKAKISFVNACNLMYDSPNSIINAYLAKEYFDSDLIEEKIVKIGEVTIDDVVNFSNKICLDTIFLLEGGNNEKE